jgi:hypothetical protein
MLAPYILTCLVHRPGKLAFVSIDMYKNGDGSLEDILREHQGEKEYDTIESYRASKVHKVISENASARPWPDVKSNSLYPVWVPPELGGANASEDTEAAVATYVMLA